MIDINIFVKDNKSVKVSNSIVGNKFENMITKINFNFDECRFDKRLVNKYFAIKNENLKTDYKLIDIKDNYIILDYDFSKNYGIYDCLIILSEKEITEYVPTDINNFVSDMFNLYINDNFMEDINNLEVKDNKEAK